MIDFIEMLILNLLSINLELSSALFFLWAFLFLSLTGLLTSPNEPRGLKASGLFLGEWKMYLSKYPETFHCHFNKEQVKTSFFHNSQSFTLYSLWGEGKFFQSNSMFEPWFALNKLLSNTWMAPFFRSVRATFSLENENRKLVALLRRFAENGSNCSPSCSEDVTQSMLR